MRPIVGRLVLTTALVLSASCRLDAPTAPTPGPAPALVVRGTVEAHGTPRQGVRVGVRAMQGLDSGSSACGSDGDWTAIAEARGRSGAAGRFDLRLVADSTHHLVAGKEEVAACVHVLAFDPADSAHFVMQEISDRMLRSGAAPDTLDVTLDVSLFFRDAR